MNQPSLVLIVDDEPAGREVMRALLVDPDYELVLASCGAEALEIASRRPPDLVLLDIMMPMMDGFEVCRRLRTNPALAEVPIVMVTALDDRESRLRGLETGADDFVSKPFDRHELRTRVRTITRLNRFRRLLLEREKFEWVVEHAEDGFLIVDHDDRILYANSRARLYLGLPASGAAPITQRFLAIAGQQYRLTPEEAWQTEPEREDPPGRRPCFLVRPESATAGALWLEVDRLRLAAHLTKGHLVRLRDVTTKVVMQRDCWTYHSLIRHKLATPVTKLSLALSLLAESWTKLSESEKEAFFAIAQGGAKRLADEIERIFGYVAALDHREGGEGCTFAGIVDLIRETSAGLDLPAPSVSVAGIDQEETRVGLSRHAMELVLYELMNNAKKFHPQQSPTLEVAMTSTSDGLCFRIRDDGRSITPEQMERVWLPYFQAERNSTGEVPGMGLGLPMVAALVWSAGGACRIENRSDLPGVVVEIGLPAPSLVESRKT